MVLTFSQGQSHSQPCQFLQQSCLHHDLWQSHLNLGDLNMFRNNCLSGHCCCRASRQLSHAHAPHGPAWPSSFPHFTPGKRPAIPPAAAIFSPNAALPATLYAHACAAPAAHADEAACLASAGAPAAAQPEPRPREPYALPGHAPGEQPSPSIVPAFGCS